MKIKNLHDYILRKFPIDLSKLVLFYNTYSLSYTFLQTITPIKESNQNGTMDSQLIIRAICILPDDTKLYSSIELSSFFFIVIGCQWECFSVPFGDESAVINALFDQIGFYIFSSG